MASPVPSPVSFAAPASKELVFTWLPMFLRTLNKFIQQTVTVLLDLQDAGPSYRPLTIRTGATVADSFPVLIDNPLELQPRDVHVAQVIPEGTDALLGPVTVVWLITSQGQIQISNVTNLDVFSSYELILSVT